MVRMASIRKPKPEQIYFPRIQKLCPVCGKPSYSLSGEHPQCAIARSDAVTRSRLLKRAARRH
jgi:hypothetical protein